MEYESRDAWELVLRTKLLDVITGGFVPSPEFQSNVGTLWGDMNTKKRAMGNTVGVGALDLGVPGAVMPSGQRKRWSEGRGLVRCWVAFLLIVLGLGLQPLAGMAQATLEVRVRWDGYLGAPAPQVQPGTAQPANLFTLLERRQIAGAPQRQRNPELSSEQIVVVAVDQQGQEVFWNLIPDPRVLRSEGPGPRGEMSGEVLHHATTELLITLPDDPTIIELRLYHPRWTGTTFVLELLGTVPVR